MWRTLLNCTLFSTTTVPPSTCFSTRVLNNNGWCEQLKQVVFPASTLTARYRVNAQSVALETCERARVCARARALSYRWQRVVWLRPGEMLINTILYFYGNILNIGFQGPVHNLYEYTQTAAIKAAKWEITCSCGWCGTKPNHISQTSTCNVITLQIEPHGKRPHVDLGENRCDEHNLYCRSPLANREYSQLFPIIHMPFECGVGLICAHI